MGSNYIYAYTHTGQLHKWSRPTGQRGEFWVKVGQTKQPGSGRVRQQLITPFPNLDGVTVFFHSEEAKTPEGKTFTDRDVHKVLESHGIQNAGGEWFAASVDEVMAALVSLQRGIPFEPTRVQSFPLRKEQKIAVEQTAAYFRSGIEGSNRYLWNAKMRFGKTFAAYKLCQEMGWKKTLILTYKPAVRDQWRNDLLGHADFTGWRYADRDTDKKQARSIVKEAVPLVWFASFQDVTGKDPMGKPKPRNEILHEVEWDCIIIDEFHFGASTAAAREIYDPQDRFEVAMAKMLENALGQEDESSSDVLVEPDFGLTTKFHLHLSGTPFKALTNGRYSEDQVFNWTYVDEQKEKNDWDLSMGKNPYEALPEMQMYTYRIGTNAESLASNGEFDGFTLNTYFHAENINGSPEFRNPDNVKSFLELIKGKNINEAHLVGAKINAPFPYQGAMFAEGVRHSIWFMQNVAACQAMARMLAEDPFFAHFEIHVAAGRGAGTGSAALPPLHKAIKRSVDNNKSGTITLSCGKLMTGVTVPEWSSIFVLCSLKAPEAYFQAAFRVQSPWVIDEEIRKKTAYIFEFDPNRALGLVARYGTELSTNSSNPSATQESVLGELLNFLPIFAVDSGHMERLDVEALLDWAHSGISANSLYRRWDSSDLYNLDAMSMGALLEDTDLLAELEQIEDFREVRRQAEAIVTNSSKIRELKIDGGGAKEQTPPKKALAKERSNLRKKLKKISAKVLIFMYLTDFREEQLSHVVNSIDTELFHRSTGLKLSSYRRLVEIGVVDEANMTDAIQKFRYFERSSIRASLNGFGGSP